MSNPLSPRLLRIVRRTPHKWDCTNFLSRSLLTLPANASRDFMTPSGFDIPYFYSMSLPPTFCLSMCVDLFIDP